MDGMKLEVRLAEFADFQAVLDIDDNIYDGRDYLQYLYYILLQDKMCNPYVMIVNGKICGFLNYLMMDDGQRILSMAARMNSTYRGKGVYYKLSKMAFEDVVRRHPKARLISWAQINHPRSWKLHTDPEVVVALRAYTFTVNYDDLPLFENTEPNIPVNDIKAITPSETAKIVSNETTRKELFPTKYFLGYIFWELYRVDEKNLNIAGKKGMVSVSMTPDGACESLTFVAIHPITVGVRLDLWIYGSTINSNTVLAHVYFWLRHIKKIMHSKSGSVYLLIYFPIHVDKQEVRRHLTAKTGPPLETESFDSDEALGVVREMIPTTKL